MRPCCWIESAMRAWGDRWQQRLNDKSEASVSYNVSVKG